MALNYHVIGADHPPQPVQVYIYFTKKKGGGVKQETLHQKRGQVCFLKRYFWARQEHNKDGSPSVQQKLDTWVEMT